MHRLRRRRDRGTPDRYPGRPAEQRSEPTPRRGKRIAAVALARRLTGILFAIWRDGRASEVTRIRPPRPISVRAVSVHKLNERIAIRSGKRAVPHKTKLFLTMLSLEPAETRRTCGKPSPDRLSGVISSAMTRPRRCCVARLAAERGRSRPDCTSCPSVTWGRPVADSGKALRDSDFTGAARAEAEPRWPTVFRVASVASEAVIRLQRGRSDGAPGALATGRRTEACSRGKSTASRAVGPSVWNPWIRAIQPAVPDRRATGHGEAVFNPFRGDFRGEQFRRCT